MRLQAECSNPQAALREIAGHDDQQKIEIYLPSDLVFAATEQADLYHLGDVNGLLIEAITDYLTHRNALPVTTG